MAFVESEVVELKAEIVGDICKEVIAFANTKGGTLYIGVSNDGSVVGVKNADQVILQMNNMIRDSIKPDVTMFGGDEAQHISDKDIIAVTIQKGTDRPYYLSSKGLKPSGCLLYTSIPSRRRACQWTGGCHTCRLTGRLPAGTTVSPALCPPRASGG